MVGQKGNNRYTARIQRIKGEKDCKLTGYSCACSERPEEGRGGQILPEIGEEEEDTPVAVAGLDSIPSPGTFLAAGRSSWESLLGSM
jgi:hypothetical protein